MADRITLNGKAPPGPSRAAASRPSDAAAAIAEAVQSGNSIDPAMLASLRGNSGALNTASQTVINRAIQDMIARQVATAARPGGSISAVSAQADQVIRSLQAAGVRMAPRTMTTQAGLESRALREAERQQRLQQAAELRARTEASAAQRQAETAQRQAERQAQRAAQQVPGSVFNRGQLDALRASPGLNPGNRFGGTGPTWSLSPGSPILTPAQQRLMAASPVLNGVPNPTRVDRPASGVWPGMQAPAGRDLVLTTLRNIDKSTAGSFKVESTQLARITAATGGGGRGAGGGGGAGGGAGGGGIGGPPGPNTPWNNANFWNNVNLGGSPPIGGGGGGVGGGGGGGGGGRPPGTSGFFGAFGAGGSGKGLFGYGMGKAVSRLPIVGGMLSNIIEAGALGGPAAAGVATLIEGVEAYFTQNKMLGDWLGGKAGQAKKYTNFAIATQNVAGPSGANPDKLMAQLYNRNSEGLIPSATAPELLRRYGRSADEFMADIGGFGIVQRADPFMPSQSTARQGGANGGRGPRGATQISHEAVYEMGRSAEEANIDLGASLNEFRRDTRFQGMNQDMLKGQAAEMAAYGFVSGDSRGVDTYRDKMGAVMTEAVHKGIDRTRMSESIVSAMGMGARSGGVAMNEERIGGYMMGLTNLPGGRTGELGLTSMAGMNAAADMVGSAPVQSAMYMQAAQKYGSREKLTALFGGQIPESAKNMADNYLEAMKDGNMPMAAKWFAEMVKSDPEIQGRVADDFTKGFGKKYERDAAYAVANQQPYSVAAEGRNFGGKSGPKMSPEAYKDAQARFMDHFMNGPLHLTKEQAAGMVGNLAAESGLNFKAVNPNGMAGIAQWDTNRRAAAAKYYNVKDFSELSENQQLGYIDHELQTTEAGALKRLRATTSYEGAAAAVNHYYERSETTPEGYARSDAKRANFAGQMMGVKPAVGEEAQKAFDVQAGGGAAEMSSSENSFRIISGVMTQLNVLAENIKANNAIIKRANMGNPFGGLSGADHGAYGVSPQKDLGYLGN